MMVNNSTNINKINNHLSSLLTEYNKRVDHNTWRRKSRYWLGTGSKMWQS